VKLPDRGSVDQSYWIDQKEQQVASPVLLTGTSQQLQDHFIYTNNKIMMRRRRRRRRTKKKE
jgi:hypothetical protein